MHFSILEDRLGIDTVFWFIHDNEYRFILSDEDFTHLYKSKYYACDAYI